LHHAHPLVGRSGVDAADDEAGLVVNRRRQGRGRGHGDGDGDRRDLVGRVLAVVAPARQYRGGLGGAIEDAGKRHDGTERMRAELERRHHAEVAAAAAQRPEQIGLRFRGRGADGPVRAHHARRDEAVDRQAVLAAHPALAATQGQTGDAGLGHDPAGDDEAEGLGFAVEVGPERAALHSGDPCVGIDLDAAHPRQIDDHPVVAAGMAGDRMTAAADRDQQVMLAREVDGIDDIRRAGAPDDQCRTPPMHGVVDGSLGICRIRRLQHLSTD
jgi:hypothetical protein